MRVTPITRETGVKTVHGVYCFGKPILDGLEPREWAGRPVKWNYVGTDDPKQGCRIVESAWEPKFCAWQSA